ncbi:right-handed parallel beta-helix repeat-containing protein [Hymenobacter wooponensis]|uniref:T9SS type A sorting domain-containing protein n=1 Tax=Hymenobacter wooponensis TaxID=1525360 RepID=A0A4Z0MS71_9BACT|nr:right-handed parallel beta-helix repeat-containing protein [Hymenobacter wooponensis]TGD82434.1 T9SS type A sorting domain-containing protein [Hymenobacter wooponensis]
MKKPLLCLLLLVSCYLAIGRSAMATTYYVSAKGNDSGAGTTLATAWQSIDRVNQEGLKPGDKIKFEGGKTFVGTLDARNSGTAAQPIIYTSYGKEAAIISSGVERGFVAYNTDALELRRLTFVGAGRDANQTGGVIFYRDNTDNSATQLQHIIIDSLDVSGYKSYGITIGSYAPSVDYWGAPFGYNDVRISNTATHDNGDTGLFSYGATLHAHHNWYVGNCQSYNNSGQASVTDRNTGSGIILANVDEAMIEQCEAYNNGWLSNHAYTGPAGIWAYACNEVIIQKCESHNNRSGTIDGGGFDLDGGCTNSTLQYNYSHDNEGPGLMLAQYNGAPVAIENITVRYNISENDARRYGAGILLWSSGASGGIQKVDIYNNTVYITPSSSGYVPQAVHVASPSIEATALRNNIFQTTGGVPMLLDQGGRVVFQGNCYWSSGSPVSWRQWSSTYSSLEEWRASTGAERLKDANTGMFVDPKLTSPGAGGTNPRVPGQPMSAWKPYQLLAGSPLIGAGLDLYALFGITPGPHDMYGYLLPSAGSPANIGAQGGGSGGSPLPVELISFQAKLTLNKVSLQWATATELNSASFEIQRSIDGTVFTRVGQVAAAGHSTTKRTYTWDDTRAPTQTTYYRLRQLDLDGSSHFSSIAVVAPAGAGRHELSVFPNPVEHGEQLFLNVAPLAGQPIRITITSLTGQVAFQQQLVADGTSPSAVRLPAQLASGTYMVSISSSQHEVRTRLVVE